MRPTDEVLETLASRAFHILVNNAGICICKPLLGMSYDAQRRQMPIKLDGVSLGTMVIP